MSLITLVLDIISFFVVFGQAATFNGGDNANNAAVLTASSAYIGRILIIMLFLACDIFFILWVLHFRARMGQDERAYVHKALLGFGDGMRIAFGVMPKGNEKQSMPRN